MSELLTINSISVSYGNIKALRGVSIHVDEGDIVCLIGANGAGKSTLLKAIVGLKPINTGSISYKGQVIANSAEQSLSKKRLIPNKANLIERSLRTDEIAA